MNGYWNIASKVFPPPAVKKSQGFPIAAAGPTRLSCNNSECTLHRHPGTAIDPLASKLTAPFSSSSPSPLFHPWPTPMWHYLQMADDAVLLRPLQATRGCGAQPLRPPNEKIPCGWVAAPL